jgi:hypothetical protein
MCAEDAWSPNLRDGYAEIAGREQIGLAMRVRTHR